MTRPLARARAPKHDAHIPAAAEQDFAAGVVALAALIRSQAEQLTKKGEAGPLTMQESRCVANLAQAAKALQSGSLWGARAIRAKVESEKK